MSGGGAEKGRERILGRLSAVTAEPDMWFDLMKSRQSLCLLIRKFMFKSNY